MKTAKRFVGILTLLAVILAGCAGCETTEETEPAVYDTHYAFYDYQSGEYVSSQVATYQAVTGTECEVSALDFSFLEENYDYVVEGYVERYGVFLYAYQFRQLREYQTYLRSMGYSRVGTERYTEGVSYYYENAENGYMLDLFVAKDRSYLAVEPYLPDLAENG